LKPRAHEGLFVRHKLAELPVHEAVAFAGVRLLGHQQVTDACLLGLAIRRGGVLATLDKRIEACTEPKSTERKALESLD